MAIAEIVSIGSELLLGQIVDTNASWMAQRLTEIGVDLYFKTIVGDNPDRMQEVIGQALERSDIVITGGGIGPTQDDLTREIIARVTGRELVLDRHLAEQIEFRFQRRGLIMTANNQRQAYIPQGAIPVENPNGTAPSFIVEDPRRRGLRIARRPVRDEVALRQRGRALPAKEVQPGRDPNVPRSEGGGDRREQRRRSHRPPHRGVEQSDCRRARAPRPGRCSHRGQGRHRRGRTQAHRSSGGRGPPAAGPSRFRRRQRDHGGCRWQAAQGAERDHRGLRGPHRGSPHGAASASQPSALRAGDGRQRNAVAALAPCLFGSCR